jgi:hypothetical protein
MIGVGTSLLFGRKAGKAGPPIPPFNEAMVDAWFMSGLSNADKPGSITGVMGNEMQLKNFVFTSESGFGEGSYEGALVFDGVDDYGICTGLPILDDYTLICRRVLENNTKNIVASKSVVAGNGAFIFEYGNNATYSFSEYTSGLAVNLKDSVSYQTKNSYNGSTITVGNADDTDTLTLGIIRERDSRILKGAIYYFALYNKSLTIEEVEEEKVKLENYWEGGKNELA